MPESNITPSTQDPSYEPAESSAPVTNWYEGERYSKLPGDDATLLSKYKTEEDFVNGSISAMRMVGKKSTFNAEIPKPDDPAYADKMSSLYDQLDRPKRPDAYEVPLLDIPEELKDRIGFSEALVGQAKELAFKYRLPQDALNELATLQQQSLIDSESGVMKARLDRAAETEKELSKDPNYTLDREMVKRLLTHEGNPDLWAELETTGLGNSPTLFKILAAHAKHTLGEGEIDSAKNTVGGANIDPGKPKPISRQEYYKQKYPYTPSMWENMDPKDMMRPEDVKPG